MQSLILNQETSERNLLEVPVRKLSTSTARNSYLDQLGGDDQFVKSSGESAVSIIVTEENDMSEMSLMTSCQVDETPSPTGVESAINITVAEEKTLSVTDLSLMTNSESTRKDKKPISPPSEELEMVNFQVSETLL